MAQSLPYALSCKGGLNTNVNQFEIIKTPGSATVLENFEVDTDGGYRRINGFAPYGGSSATSPNSNNAITGLFVYADGVIAASGTNIYFTLDGITWLQINKASVDASGDNYTAFTGRSVAARTSQGECTITVYEGDSTYGEVIITDSASATKPFYFKMTGSGALTNRTYFAKEITVSGTVFPKVCIIHDKHLVVAGDTNNSNTIYYSGTDDIDDFTSTGSGSIKLDDKVIGLRSFRDDLIIFCKNSIYKLQNINIAASIVVTPITKNVGCLANKSIQEFSGDLVFLSPDGVRTLAGTAKIGDVELSSLSRAVQPVINTMVGDINSLVISSLILRNKSQYRLFYATSSQAALDSKGLIGSITAEGMAWSETKGIQARSATSGFAFSGVEEFYHGDNEGHIYIHNSGNSFYHSGEVAKILATYKTPSFDFGDHGTRKTLNYLKLSVTPEGIVEPTLRVRYDYEDTALPQPPDYSLDAIKSPAVFGTSVFSSAFFGASNDPTIRQAVQGSGHTANFRIRSFDTNAPYAINGLYIDYTPANRR